MPCMLGWMEKRSKIPNSCLLYTEISLHVACEWFDTIDFGTAFRAAEGTMPSLKDQLDIKLAGYTYTDLAHSTAVPFFSFPGSVAREGPGRSSRPVGKLGI